LHITVGLPLDCTATRWKITSDGTAKTRTTRTRGLDGDACSLLCRGRHTLEAEEGLRRNTKDLRHGSPRTRETWNWEESALACRQLGKWSPVQAASLLHDHPSPRAAWRVVRPDSHAIGNQWDYASRTRLPGYAEGRIQRHLYDRCDEHICVSFSENLVLSSCIEKA
jgi:hypothetical protein